jgi:DNA-binding MarR family transcriptional regulator
MPDGSTETSPLTLAFLLSQVGGRSAQVFAELLSPLHLVPAEAGILRLLDRSAGISQQELARRLNMHASRMVAILDGLEERGLLARETNTQDRRIYCLRLTAAGREALLAIGRQARAHEEAMCAGLNDTERVQLGKLLHKIAAQHGLAPGIHPGYRTLGSKEKQSGPTRPQRGHQRAR